MEIKKQSRGIIETPTYKEETTNIIPHWYYPEGEGKARLVLGMSDKQVISLGILREPC